MSKNTTLGGLNLRPLTALELDRALFLSGSGDTRAVLHSDGSFTFHAGAADYCSTCIIGTEIASRIIRDEE